MKNLFIIERIEFYDKNKGYGRSLKDEPHIKELRTFLTKIGEKERYLYPADLLDLVTILLGKKSRSESLSSKVFQELANEFGGFEVLDLLQENNCLNADNLDFLERNSTQAQQLAPFIVSLKNKINPSEMHLLFSSSMKLTDEDRLFFFKFLDDSTDTNRLHYYVKILDSLKRHKIHIENAVHLLEGVDEVQSVHQHIKSLISSDLSLLTADNVTRILKLQHPYSFGKLFQVLPATQEHFDSLMEVEGTLDKSLWAEDIIKNFKAAEWELNTWLKRILTPTEYSFELSQATTMLKDIKMSSEHRVQILSRLFDYPKGSSKFAEAVVILNGNELTTNDLTLLCREKENPGSVAKAIVALKEEKSYRQETLKIVTAYPEHALGVACIFIFFDKINAPFSEECNSILERPECAEMTAKVLEYLRENELHGESNILSVCQAKISHAAFFNLLKLMKSVDILEQSTLELLVPQMKFMKTLLSAANCLAEAKKLDKINFGLVLKDPLNAIFLAENLGGKVSTNMAKSVVSIRQSASVLAQGQRQHLFFAAMTDKEVESFVKATNKTPTTAQNDILMKVAKYCGNNSLAEETEHHIASTAYSSSPTK